LNPITHVTTVELFTLLRILWREKMKKMTWDEWKEHEAAKRKQYKEMGVADFNAHRAEKMWNDPNVKDEDIPAVKFEYDKELGEMVFAGYINQVEH